ncbi:CHASE2 domain-containing protein [Acuticoccus yangtzensis]|uniref:CHASE2 domain-containing protein n=1 Tax=Acuticoccus yangtzensis TaxID=1443441 RepID=UPI000949A4AE|nr:adenylate/guanylate cyclase domain-containing protein [Acuticoccus yangtzensis]
MKDWRRIARARASTELGLLTIAVAVALALTGLSETGGGRTLRARIFDQLTAYADVGAAPQPVVVDIERRTLDLVGPWPWGRSDMARLVGAIADAGAKVLAVDILLDGPDDRSAAALARRLAAAGVALPVDPSSLTDGDEELAAALSRVPAVLGVALAPEMGAPVPPPPVMVRGTFVADGLWLTGGLHGPIPVLAEAAAGFGALSLPGSVDGTIREVPLLAIAGRQPVPGLALEVHRIAGGGAPIIIDPAAGTLQAGPHVIPLGEGGLMRLIPVPAAERLARRVAAADILSGDPAALSRLEGAVVLLGSSAAETGGLRTGADGTLVPSVDLQADAVAQIAAGAFPVRAPHAGWVESAAIMLGAVAGLLAARFASPAGGAVVVGAAALAWVSGAAILSASHLWLIDPVMPAASAALTFGLGSILVSARARRQARRVQSAFEQHLSPAVVRRIASSPDTIRLKGEAREVTALFTDIEGFSAMTAAAEPEALIALLDAYYDAITSVAVAHDGMVAKLIGDSMNALFNVPFDLPAHPQRALDCAIALVAASEAFEQTPAARALGLGRTRIGLDTGHAIVGDVGGSRKLDYTAHGAAVNAASRFEQANKNLGTSIVVGPGAAARLSCDLRPLGLFTVRGFPEPLSLFTVWEPDVGAAERQEIERTVASFSATPIALDALTPADYRALFPPRCQPQPASRAG